MCASGIVAVRVAEGTPPRYEVEFVSPHFIATSMSPAGVAAGIVHTGDNTNFQFYLSIFSNGTRNILPIQSGESFFTTGVNNNSQLTGWYMSAQSNYEQVPFVASETEGISFLPVPDGRSGFATGISETGVVVGGVYESGGSIPTVWLPSESGYLRQTLSLPDSQWRARPLAISNSGVVGGRLETFEGRMLPGVWANDEVDVLSLPEGSDNGEVSHLGTDGVAYGHIWNDHDSDHDRMAMWIGNQIQLLPELNTGFIQAIGPNGEVLAYANATTISTSWLLDDGTWYDISSLVDAPFSFSLRGIVGMDNTGCILAQGIIHPDDIDYEWGLFRLVPVPSPGVVGVGAVCFAAMVCTRRRDRA